MVYELFHNHKQSDNAAQVHDDNIICTSNPRECAQLPNLKFL